MILDQSRDTNVAMVDLMVRQYDRTIRVLWNNRTKRYVVAQHLPKWMPVTKSLRGIVGLEGKRCQYKCMFVCETDEGFPVVPGAWIVRRLKEACPLAADSEDQKREIERENEAQERVRHDLRLRADEMGKELSKYGGVSKYREDGVGRQSIDLGRKSMG